MAHAMQQSAVPEFSLGDRLRRARAHLGVTQEELAGRLDIGLRQIKEGEADKRPLKRAIVLGWAVACGVDPYWLLTGEPDTGTTIGGYQLGEDLQPASLPVAA